MHVVQMAIYTINRVLETPNAQENGVVIFHDLKGLVCNNLDVRIPKIVVGWVSLELDCLSAMITLLEQCLAGIEGNSHKHPKKAPGLLKYYKQLHL
jgi:hypothetical protein|mmetsp:Transcript_13216/g.23931  ORF Transcript_13216/g.23931 Transcript_13216/m.23931 type:complete len:96 (+) Transcript_13216:800-1087(+)